MYQLQRVKMRFTATGPDIPNELIDAQKRGELLFFCGAGVSVPAGLPSFEKLTKNVAEKLYALDEHDSEISKLLFNNEFDRTFTVLKRVYGDKNVASLLLNELRLPKNPFLANHENLLKISTNEKNEPFIVTTNFDLLFEKVNTKIRSFVPPYLPDLQSKESLSGIVYLHGKWNNPKANKSNNLIISSQNFGSAYLSHGWATKFLSSLLTRRTVVLIGYSGDDTLVRYLLEGLNSEGSNTNSIYAFERGEQGYIQTKWSQLGATGISYGSHSDLWETIKEWAKYTGNEQKWDEYIKQLAQQSPKNLAPFERGIIANYISTIDGAYKFMEFNPTPCSEWIYVFDKTIRLGDINKIETSDGKKIAIDPIDLYGTDLDLSRSELDFLNKDSQPKIGHDYIRVMAEESKTSLPEGMSNIGYQNLCYAQSKISALAIWFSKVAEQPAAIWWAQQQKNLHPIIINQVKRRILENPSVFSENNLNFWVQNITNHVDKNKRPLLTHWYEIKRVLEKEPHILSNLYLSYLEDILTPMVSIQDHNLRNIYLPTGTSQIDLLFKFDIDFYEYESDNIKIHNEHLEKTIKILTKSFVQYIELLDKTKDDSIKIFFHDFYFPPINFDNPLEPQTNIYKKIGNLILWMCDLLKKSILFNEESLIEIVKGWPNNDDLIFSRLKLFILIHSKNINRWPIDEYTKELSENFFWNTYIESDLMLFISQQWDNLNIVTRVMIENKIISYRQISDYEPTENFLDRKNYQVGRLLNTIDQTKLGLSTCAAQEFIKIKNANNWLESSLKQESSIPGIQGGLISTNTSFDELTSVTDSSKFFETVESLESDRSTYLERKKPFIGFIEKNLSESLNKLLAELEKNNYREKYWHQLWENTPSDTNSEILTALGNAILKLPSEVVFTCRFSITRWLDKKFINACKSQQDLFWRVWDFIFKTLNSIGPKATNSLFGETFKQGRKIKQSRKTFEHAMNSPIGQLVDVIFSIYNVWDIKQDKLQDEILSRLEMALRSKGEGAHHATSMIIRRFNFMYENYEHWSQYHLTPIFNIKNQNCEAAWESFFHIEHNPSHKSILTLKPFFIELFDNDLEWLKDERFKNNLASLLIQFCYFSYPRQILFTNIEVRKILRKFDNDMLSYSLWILLDIIKKKNSWLKFGRFFFKNIWPKENISQTSKTSSRLLNLAVETSEHFTDVVKIIEPYLRNIESPSIFLYQLINNQDQNSLTTNYPDEVLLLLDKVVGQKIETYDNSLSTILEQLVISKPVLKNSMAWQRLNKLSTRPSEVL